MRQWVRWPTIDLRIGKWFELRNTAGGADRRIAAAERELRMGRARELFSMRPGWRPVPIRNERNRGR